MKIELKMAAGVFGVALVALLALKGPKWGHKVEEVRQESILASLTPDKAIAKCGKLIEDKSELNGATITRRLILRNYYGLAVELDFTAAQNQPDKWKLTEIQDPSGEVKYDTPSSKMGVLPCLDPLKKEEKVAPPPQ